MRPKDLAKPSASAVPSEHTYGSGVPQLNPACADAAARRGRGGEAAALTVVGNASKSSRAIASDHAPAPTGTRWCSSSRTSIHPPSSFGTRTRTKSVILSIRWKLKRTLLDLAVYSLATALERDLVLCNQTRVHDDDGTVGMRLQRQVMLPLPPFQSVRNFTDADERHGILAQTPEPDDGAALRR